MKETERHITHLNSLALDISEAMDLIKVTEEECDILRQNNASLEDDLKSAREEVLSLHEENFRLGKNMICAFVEQETYFVDHTASNLFHPDVPSNTSVLSLSLHTN